MSFITEILTKIEQKLSSKKNMSLERKQALLEEANCVITNQFLERNSIRTKMCRNSQIKLDKFITKKGYTLISGPNEHSIAKFETTDKDNFGSIVTKEERLCFNDKCNYAHRDEDLRKPLCIYNIFNCCTNKKCENDHSNRDPPRDLNLGSKVYKDENGNDIFKIFYYINSIRIYDYSNKVTFIVNINDDIFIETSVNTIELIESVKDNFFRTVQEFWYPFSKETKNENKFENEFENIESFISCIMTYTIKNEILNTFKLDELKFEKILKFNEIKTKLETYFLTKNNHMNSFVRYYNILDFALNTDTIECLNLIIQNYNLCPVFYNNFYILYFSVASAKILSYNKENKVLNNGNFVSIYKDKSELRYFNLREFIFYNVYELNCTYYPDIMNIFNSYFNSFFKLEFFKIYANLYTDILKEVGSLPIFEILNYIENFELCISYFKNYVKSYIEYYKINSMITTESLKKNLNVDIESNTRSESPLLKEFNSNNYTVLV